MTISTEPRFRALPLCRSPAEIGSAPRRLRVFALCVLAAADGRPLSRFRSRVVPRYRSPSPGSPGPNHGSGSLARADVTFTRGAPLFLPRSPSPPASSACRKETMTRLPASPGSQLMRFRVRYTATYVAPATPGAVDALSSRHRFFRPCCNVSAVIRPGSAAAFARVVPAPTHPHSCHAPCGIVPPPKITPLRGGFGRPSGAIFAPPAPVLAGRLNSLARSSGENRRRLSDLALSPQRRHHFVFRSRLDIGYTESRQNGSRGVRV